VPLALGAGAPLGEPLPVALAEAPMLGVFDGEPDTEGVGVGEGEGDAVSLPAGVELPVFETVAAAVPLAVAEAIPLSLLVTLTVGVPEGVTLIEAPIEEVPVPEPE